MEIEQNIMFLNINHVNNHGAIIKKVSQTIHVDFHFQLGHYICQILESWGMQHGLNQGGVINLWECIMGACSTG